MICIALLIKSTDILRFRQILENILIVSMSETDGNNIHQILTPSEIAQTKLTEYIATGHIQFEEQYDINSPYKGIDDNDFFITENNTSTSDESDESKMDP